MLPIRKIHDNEEEVVVKMVSLEASKIGLGLDLNLLIYNDYLHGLIGRLISSYISQKVY